MNRVSKRYAKALFELAKEQNKLEKIDADFLELKKLVDTNDEFNNFIANPLISKSVKYQIVKQLFESKLDDLTYRFLLLVNEKNRISLLPEMIERFNVLLLNHRNQVEGEVVSVVELSGLQIGNIQSNIEDLIGKTVILKQRLDPDVLGGFVVKVQDIIIDNSVRYQLIKLREKLLA
ncbi:MAG: ATP synthase F1 subunit delta [Calditrichaceae bacterium]